MQQTPENVPILQFVWVTKLSAAKWKQFGNKSGRNKVPFFAEYLYLYIFFDSILNLKW